MAAGFFTRNVCVAMHQLRIDRRSINRTKSAHANGRTIIVGTGRSATVTQAMGAGLFSTLSRNTHEVRERSRPRAPYDLRDPSRGAVPNRHRHADIFGPVAQSRGYGRSATLVGGKGTGSTVVEKRELLAIWIQFAEHIFEAPRNSLPIGIARVFVVADMFQMFLRAVDINGSWGHIHVSTPDRRLLRGKMRFEVFP